MSTSQWNSAGALAIGLQLALAGVCAAQTPAASGAAAASSPGYLQIGPVLSTHAENEQDFRTGPALSGATAGAALVVGGRVSPLVALEAEVFVDGALSDTQSFSDGTFRDAYTAESRDIVFGANLRVRPPGNAHLEFVAGGGLALTRFARRDIVTTTTFPPIVSTRSSDRETSNWAPTLSGAIAGWVPVSRRLELVPSVGVRWIRREVDSDAWSFGLGRYMMTVNVALRFMP